MPIRRPCKHFQVQTAKALASGKAPAVWAVHLAKAGEPGPQKARSPERGERATGGISAPPHLSPGETLGMPLSDTQPEATPLHAWGAEPRL